MSKEKEKIILRDYQYEGHKNLIMETKGIYLSPTSSGKTVSEAVVVAHKTKLNPDKNISVVLTPRILLNQQMAREISNILTKNRVIKHNNGEIFVVEKDTRIIVFHSGEYNPPVTNERNWKEISTTNPEVVLSEVDKANQMNQNVVIISTYHSCGRLAGIQNINTIISDEAHHLTHDDFHKNFSTLSADNKFFFTATAINGTFKDGRGMNNDQVYGRVLHRALPKNLIRDGWITDIRLHFSNITTSNKNKTFIDEITKISKVNISFLNKMPHHKILFATGGTEYINKVEKHIDSVRKSMPGFDIFTISAANGARINGEKVNRTTFLSELNKNRNALIFHYNILTEGLDVGDITGIVIDRNLDFQYFLQTIGRAMRIYKPNPVLKPYAVITVTSYNNDEEMVDYAVNMFDQLHSSGFEMSTEKVFTDDKIDHMADQDNIEDAYGLSTKDLQTTLGQAIEHHIYNDGFSRNLNDIVDEDGNIDFEKLDKFQKEYM